MNSLKSIPTDIRLPDIYHQVSKNFKKDDFANIWLVGGAIRATILNNPVVDLDFVIQGNAIACARYLADELNADYFTLDAKRGVGRVLLRNEARTVIDISCLHHNGIESDMLSRDFTINAIAMRCQSPKQIIDPTGGLDDILRKEIRMVSEQSFTDDPIRLIRAIRIAVQTGFAIKRNTRTAIRKHVERLGQVSTERVRDEFMRCLSSKSPVQAIHLLSHLNMMRYILVDWDNNNVEQALSKLRALESLVAIILPKKTPDAACEYALGLFASTAGQFRPELEKHLSETVSDKSNRRRRYQLMYVAVLLRSLSVSSERKRLVNLLKLSKSECAMISAMTIIEDLPESLSIAADSLIRKHKSTQADSISSTRARSIHTYFRKNSTVGIEMGLLTLAEILSKYGPQIPHELWERKLAAMFALLDGYFDRYDQLIRPQDIINGNDLIMEFGYNPGQEIGAILQQITEAQAAGEVLDRDAALVMARQLHASSKAKYDQ